MTDACVICPLCDRMLFLTAAGTLPWHGVPPRQSEFSHIVLPDRIPLWCKGSDQEFEVMT